MYLKTLFSNKNLSNIDKLDIQALKNVSLLQFTLYGINEEDYRHYAQSCDFNRVCKNMVQMIL